MTAEPRLTAEKVGCATTGSVGIAAALAIVSKSTDVLAALPSQVFNAVFGVVRKDKSYTVPPFNVLPTVAPE